MNIFDKIHPQVKPFLFALFLFGIVLLSSKIYFYIYNSQKKIYCISEPAIRKSTRLGPEINVRYKYKGKWYDTNSSFRYIFEENRRYIIELTENYPSWSHVVDSAYVLNSSIFPKQGCDSIPPYIQFVKNRY